uniref:Uncharacterized protein n=1 Tax=Erpetoichthys calabaricus TaxID=27687 RepID=A0A8C4RS58_ERPCA
VLTGLSDKGVESWLWTAHLIGMESEKRNLPGSSTVATTSDLTCLVIKVSSESCCFLRQMLGFYLRNVFSHYTSSISMVRRRISSLANGLVSMEKTLSECVSLPIVWYTVLFIVQWVVMFAEVSFQLLSV